jgi:tetratricopeptide (TPR) repeat protein
MMRPLFAALVFATLVLLPGRAAPEAQGRDLVREAFQLAYNLDHPAAVDLLRQAIAANPSDSRAQRGLASILWLQMLFRRGAVSVDNYLGSISKTDVSLPKPDPGLAEEFRVALARAIELAEARLKTIPNDVQAQYDAGAAYGIQASYTASVEGSVSKAFGMARKAFQTQERVLERDPRRVEAGLVVGTYRYIVSTLNLPTRWMAYIVGFHGDKEKGIAMIEAAATDADTWVDASAALMLIYSRERRHADVVKIARDLSVRYPRNRLFVLEEGAAAIRAGKAAEAEAALTRGLGMFERDTRAKVPGEHALWLYKRGLARLNLNHLPDATADLQRALQLNPTEWVRGRAHVTLGQVADVAGRRKEAVVEYQTARSICRAVADEACEKEASQFLRTPFVFKAPAGLQSP